MHHAKKESWPYTLELKPAGKQLLYSGPGQMAKSDQGVIALWMVAHYFGRPLYICFHGRGKQVRDFLHIDDLVELVIKQLCYWEVWQGRALNIDGGVAHILSLIELTSLCCEITGKSIPISADPKNRPADPRFYISNARRTFSLTDWRPRRGDEETPRDIFNRIRTEEGALRPIFSN